MPRREVLHPLRRALRVQLRPLARDVAEQVTVSRATGRHRLQPRRRRRRVAVAHALHDVLQRVVPRLAGGQRLHPLQRALRVRVRPRRRDVLEQVVLQLARRQAVHVSRRRLRVAPRPLGAERLHRPVARLGVGQTLRPRQRAVEVGLTPGGGDGPHRLLLGRALESQRELRGGLRVLADQFPHHRARRVTLGGALRQALRPRLRAGQIFRRPLLRDAADGLVAVTHRKLQRAGCCCCGVRLRPCVEDTGNRTPVVVLRIALGQLRVQLQRTLRRTLRQLGQNRRPRRALFVAALQPGHRRNRPLHIASRPAVEHRADGHLPLVRARQPLRESQRGRRVRLRPARHQRHQHGVEIPLRAAALELRQHRRYVRRGKVLCRFEDALHDAHRIRVGHRLSQLRDDVIERARRVAGRRVRASRVGVARFLRRLLRDGGRWRSGGW